MAIHPNIPSMLQESLPEMLLVAKYSIEFQKNTKIWPAPGCYGYPAALLLLSIADSIGSYVEQGSVENHFKVLNNKGYYGLNLAPGEIKIIYDKYRNLLSHNSVIATDVGLKIGSPTDPVLSKHNGRYWLSSVPLYNSSVTAVTAFLGNTASLATNQTVLDIAKKSPQVP